MLLLLLMFQITKQGCGSEKSCYSEPEYCTNSSNCAFLVTFKAEGDNITFEMSGSHRYIAVGFNEKQEMVGIYNVCTPASSPAASFREFSLLM